MPSSLQELSLLVLKTAPPSGATTILQGTEAQGDWLRSTANSGGGERWLQVVQVHSPLS